MQDNTTGGLVSSEEEERTEEKKNLETRAREQLDDIKEEYKRLILALIMLILLIYAIYLIVSSTLELSGVETTPIVTNMKDLYNNLMK